MLSANVYCIQRTDRLHIENVTNGISVTVPGNRPLDCGLTALKIHFGISVGAQICFLIETLFPLVKCM